MKNTDVKEKFIELRAEGYSFDKCAEILSVNKQTLINWSKELETQIQNLKTVNLEALQQQYQISKAARIKTLSMLTQKLLKEAENRDIGGLPSDKLFKLILEYTDMLKNEASDTLEIENEEPFSISKETYRI